MSQSDCPTPEDLAAFLDGRLSREARQAMLTHLDRCPDCYEVFSESARFLQQDAPRGRVIRPGGRFGGRRVTWAIASVAAVLLVLVVLPLLWSPRSAPSAGEALLATSDLAGAMAHPESAARAVEAADVGPLGFGGGLTRERLSFRAGVGLLDLRVALKAGDRRAAEDALDDLDKLAGGQVDDEEVAGAVEAARRTARSSFFWRTRTQRSASALEQTFEDLFDRQSLAIGKWTEAGRLAASSGDREFFGKPAFSRFQESLDPASLPDDAARAALTRMDALNPTGGVPTGDMTALRQAFEDLEAVY